MVDPLPIPSGHGAGAQASGAGAPPKLAIDEQQRRALAEVLSPGEVVSGRVVQALGADQYLFSLRGRNLVASSQVPLKADSVVRIQVLAAGDDQLSLRLLGGAAGDSAQTSDPLARMQALGLPSDQLGSMVLSAFEDAGAPLGRSQVLAALATLQQAGADPSTASPAPAAPQLAGALAALAREGLPATPATIALAVRALDPALPDPGSTLVQLQQTAAAAPSDGQPAPASPGAQPPTGAPAPTAAATIATSPAISAPLAADAALAPATVPAPATVASTGIAPGPTAPSASAAPAAPTAMAAASPSPSAMAQAATFPAVATGQSQPVAGAGVTATPPAAGASVTTAPAAVSASAVPAGQAAAAPGTPSASGAGQPAEALDVADPTMAVAAAQQRTAGILPQAAGTAAGDLALRAVLGMRLPDAVADGAPGILAALALAGVRSSDASGGAAHAAPTLLKQLAVAGEAAAVRATPAPVPLAERGLVPLGMGEALVRAVREGAAQSVVKPEALVDYDLVVGLPLQDQGRPAPARLAVAERRTAAGNATYLRVDAELSHLGQVSVRLSGIEGGALAITMLADGSGGRALADALPGLADSLRELGIVAGLRVASLDEDPAAGAVGSPDADGSDG